MHSDSDMGSNPRIKIQFFGYVITFIHLSLIQTYIDILRKMALAVNTQLQNGKLNNLLYNKNMELQAVGFSLPSRQVPSFPSFLSLSVYSSGVEASLQLRCQLNFLHIQAPYNKLLVSQRISFIVISCRVIKTFVFEVFITTLHSSSKNK